MNEHMIERYEKAWLALAVVLVAVLLVVTTVNVVRSTVPSVQLHHDHKLQRVDLKNLAATPFATPGLTQNSKGEYELYMLSQAFMFNPPMVTVPVGKPITFYVTSTDVLHGLQIENTNINIEVIPGEVGSVTYTFKKAGTYRVGCNEYCGVGHQAMMTQLIAEEQK